jgi:hypothetical protein
MTGDSSKGSAAEGATVAKATADSRVLGEAGIEIKSFQTRKEQGQGQDLTGQNELSSSEASR